MRATKHLEDLSIMKLGNRLHMEVFTNGTQRVLGNILDMRYHILDQSNQDYEGIEFGNDVPERTEGCTCWS